MKFAIFFTTLLLSLTGPAIADNATSARKTTTGLPPAKDMLFWTPAQQAVAFKSFDRIYASRTVHHGSDVLALPKGPELTVKYDDGGVIKGTDEFMRANHVFGLLIIQKGHIRLERYLHGLKPTDRWVSFSMVKSVTSTLVGAAVADGKIQSVDDEVSKYVPELANSGYRGVTIRQVLNMSSGVKWNEDYLDRASDTNFIVNVLAERHSGELLRHQAGLPNAWKPDSKFEYNSGNSHLLGVVVSRATGKDLADYLSEKIWKPAGMEADATWVTDGDTGQEFAGCCLNATLRDFGRFGLFVMHNGERGSQDVLPKGWMQQATSGSPASKDYSFQWWLIPEKHLFEALGVFGQTIAISPADQTVVVALSTWPKPLVKAATTRLNRYIDGVLAAMRQEH